MHFNIFEKDKFDAQLSRAGKKFITSWPGFLFLFIFPKLDKDNFLFREDLFPHRIGAIKNVNTTYEHKSNIARNRVFDCHLSHNWRQMAIENTVSCDLLSAFVDCYEHFFIAAYPV